jgi:transcription elongation factor Elf1
MASPFRFLETDQPEWLREPVLVSCPRCGRQAIASLSAHTSNESAGAPSRVARLVCGACGHSVSSEFDPASWLGPVHVTASGRCGQCGRVLQRSLGRREKAPARSTSTLRCPGCQHRTVVPLHLTPARAGDAVDPWFGLPLWLQTSCCGEVLWARNASHLQFLANYVGATLRERAPNQNRSTVSRLPKWMKAAKHRSSILACIAHLQQTLVQAQHRVVVV